MSRQQLESLFLAHLPVVDRIIGALAHRQALPPDVAEEFGAWAKLRLIENDYAILGKFRGDSSLATYLAVVLAMLLREYRVREWGRWRPSAAARRHGQLGVRLETIVCRDGLSLAEAGERLRTSGETQLSDTDLATIVSQFPRRPQMRPTSDTAALASVEASDRTDRVVDSEATAAESVAANQALVQALGELPEQDRLIVRLHYMESMSVADIARGLALQPKPLYRRLERSLAALRRRLERAGVSSEFVRELASEL